MNDQRSLRDQLIDLHVIAIREGMYDAADFLIPHIYPPEKAQKVKEIVKRAIDLQKAMGWDE